MPRVSIGLPVYNGDKYLSEAIESVLSQTYKHFELIISDNASTDQTQSICERYAERDARIKYIRQDRNIGAARNYNYVVDIACGEYFAWIAHDDIYTQDFLLKNTIVLDQDPGVVLCFSRVIDIDEDGEFLRQMDDRLDTSSARPYRRFHDLLCRYHACFQIFGLIRLEVLKNTQLIKSYAGSDRALLAELSLRGRFCEIQEVLFLHREHPLRSTRSNPKQEMVAVWFDPNNEKLINIPTWRLLVDYIRIIKNGPISWRQQLMCTFTIVMWIKKNFKALLNDLGAAGMKLLHGYQYKHEDVSDLSD